MSSDSPGVDDLLVAIVDFRCPVCKAKQPLSPLCRRCQADLELVYKVRLRLSFLLSQPRTAEVIEELRELAPGVFGA